MNPRILRRLFVGCLLVGMAGVSAESRANNSPGSQERFQLRVSLYPWIPDADLFFRWIEVDFESRYPDIDLVVRPIRRSYYVTDLAYEPDATDAALNNPLNPDFQHLVELDTLILGTLAERGALAPFELGEEDFISAAAEAVQWNGTSFGVPHWMCGYFVISENPSVRRAKNVDDLISVLSATGTDRVDLAGGLDGSWDSVTVYLDAFRDTYPAGDLRAALEQSALDPAVETSFRHLRSACTKDSVNYCGADAVDLFATGQADAIFGYSERLSAILSHPGNTVGNLHIASVTLGDGDAPTMFTDALVLSPHCSSPRCQSAARQFASYYVSNEVFEVALMSLDAGAVPRYLLPSKRSTFDYGRIGLDQYYSQMKEEIRGARPFPNSGVPEARAVGSIRAQLRAALGL